MTDQIFNIKNIEIRLLHEKTESSIQPGEQEETDSEVKKRIRLRQLGDTASDFLVAFLPYPSPEQTLEDYLNLL